MKIVIGALAAMLLTGIGWSATAEAQGIPQGSYLQSCNGARIQGDTLIARCRTMDGREQRSSLAAVNRCVGDIGNLNGQLTCNRGPGGGYGASRQENWREGYGSSGRDEWRDEQRARCWHILDPYERDRCWSGR